jgi:DNA mismatch repair protein MutS2
VVKREPLKVLEFDRVLETIAGLSKSPASRKAILGLAPLGSTKEIEKRFAETGDIRRLSEEGTPLALSPFEDISGALRRVRPEEAVLEPAEIYSFSAVLGVISAVMGQLEGREDLRALRELTSGLTGFPELLAFMDRSVDGEGIVLDTASYTLSDLRADIRRLNARINRRLEEIVRGRDLGRFLQDDFITRRSGRWVIPVRMDAKGQVPGVVHDVSRTGETAFVEPIEIIGLANELENLVAEEKAEEIRILRELCRWIRAEADRIEEQFETVVYLDVLSSIAGFSDRLGARVPEINESSTLRLQGARHPLLMLFKGSGGEVVPLDLALGGGDRVMVITGPNAGGKTIAIKTAGLLLLMALTGIPVPARSSSSIPLVREVLLDIGDEQSIEQDLSTFSAHVSNISAILEGAGPRTLVLIDELGTGTDPREGAAIGCAVLEQLRQRGALVLATTHLIDVVGFVHRTEAMVNASMEFDAATLTPLYRLKAGEPGQSHAIETAERYGLPDSTVALARQMLGTVKVEFQNLVADLKRQRARYEEALEELTRREAALGEGEKALAERLSAAEVERKKALEEAYREARDIVLKVKRQAYEALEEVRRQRSRKALKAIEKTQEEVAAGLAGLESAPLVSIEEISEGDVVHVRSFGVDAEVTGVDRRRGRLRVRAGQMSLDVPASDIGPGRGSKGTGPEKAWTGKRPRAGDSRGAEEKTVPAELNLVGLRVDEALSRLEPFLNDAYLAGHAEARVIHGLGTGALRKAVRGHLDGHPLVSGIRRGEQSEGGAGVTVVRFKAE